MATDSKSTQVNSISQTEVENLRYHCKILTTRLKRMTDKYNTCLNKLKDLEVENEKNAEEIKVLKNLSKCVVNNDEKAIFLADLLKNCKKTP
jgi:uncharacterized protein YutE (UPF0331/DUF86 family)